MRVKASEDIGTGEIFAAVHATNSYLLAHGASRPVEQVIDTSEQPVSIVGKPGARDLGADGTSIIAIPLNRPLTDSETAQITDALDPLCDVEVGPGGLTLSVRPDNEVVTVLELLLTEFKVINKGLERSGAEAEISARKASIAAEIDEWWENT